MVRKGRPRTRETLAANMRRLMADRDWKQAELAERAGIAQKTVSQILTGSSAATIETVDAIARAFGIEVWQLLMPPASTELEKAQELARLVQQVRGSTDTDRDVIINLVDRMTRK